MGMQKRTYVRPQMEAVELDHQPMMQQASPTGTPTISSKKATMSVTYEEVDWDE